MPRVDMDNLPEEKTFTLIPVGKYLVEVDDIEEVFTKNNDPMWKIKLKIVDPQFPTLAGQKLFDNWVFNYNAMNRIKLIAKAFGLPYQGVVEILEEHVLGKEVIVEVKHETKPDKYGEKVKRAVIPFSGYEKYNPGGESALAPTPTAPVKTVVKKSGLASASVPATPVTPLVTTVVASPAVATPVTTPVTTPVATPVVKTVVKKAAAPPPPPPQIITQYVDENGNPCDAHGNLLQGQTSLTPDDIDFNDVPF